MSDPYLKPMLPVDHDLPEVLSLELAVQMAESYFENQVRWLNWAPSYLVDKEIAELMRFECAQFTLLVAAARAVSCPVCEGTGLILCQDDCPSCCEYRDLIKQGIDWKEFGKE